MQLHFDVSVSFCFKLNANIEKMVKSDGSKMVKVCVFVNIFPLKFCVALEYSSTTSVTMSVVKEESDEALSFCAFSPERS